MLYDLNITADNEHAASYSVTLEKSVSTNPMRHNGYMIQSNEHHGLEKVYNKMYDKRYMDSFLLVTIVWPGTIPECSSSPSETVLHPS